MNFKVIDTKTGKEADTWNIALHEEWAQSLIYCDMEGFAITEDGYLMLADECGHVVYCDPERFKVVFEDDRQHGEWIEHKWAEEFDGHLISNYECSCCHSWKRENTDFCPNCGSDNRKKCGDSDEARI